MSISSLSAVQQQQQQQAGASSSWTGGQWQPVDDDFDDEEARAGHKRAIGTAHTSSDEDDDDDADEDSGIGYEKAAGAHAAGLAGPPKRRRTAATLFTRTPRERRVLTVALPVILIALAVGLGVGLTRGGEGKSQSTTTTASGSTSTTNPTTGRPTSFGKGCNDSSLVDSAKDPKFWTVDIASPHATIRPKDSNLYSNCDQLSQAFFTVRLLYPDASIRLLEDPAQTAPGQYQYDLVAPVGRAADGTVRLEAVLELADYPGTGMPCEAEACDYSKLIAEGYSWIGKTITDDNDQLPQYKNELDALPTVTASTPPCPRLDYLPGAYNNDTTEYTPIGPDGKPCRLLTVSKSVATPEGTPLRWWRFLGDSNMRFFFVWNYPKALGATSCVKSGRKLHVLCWDNTTAWTWDWWFGEEDVAATATRLDSWLGETLNDYIYERHDDPWDLRWHNDPNLPSTLPTQFVNFTEPAERIYLSLGSHASQLTVSGWTDIMERITPILQPFKDAAVVVLTSATAPSRIPAKYIKDTVMRHNVQIKLSNAVIADYAKRLGVRVIDIFTLTRTTGPHNMIDNVHFPNTIYRIWTRLFYNERFGPGWIP